MTAAEPAGLHAVADELYGLAPEEFTAARNARAKQVQADGDRDLAAAVRKLSRPSAAAALANQLVRRSADAFEPLLELGESLRAASAALDGAQLRTLSRQQGPVVAAIVRTARELAKEDGLKVSEQTLRELDGTLRAAVADAGAAEELMAGQLVGPLEHTGFGPSPAAHLSVVRNPPAEKAGKGETAEKSEPSDTAQPTKSAPTRPEPARDDRQRARAQAAVETAETALEDAVAARKEAAANAAEIESTLTDLRHRAEQLRADLAAAQTEQARAERDQRRGREKLEKASHAMRSAARRLDDATARLEALGD